VQIAAGEKACVVLTWDDWPVTTEDYDLYLFRDSDGSLVASSTNDQSGGMSAPEEDLCFTNTDATTETFDVVIANYDAVGSPRLDLYYLGSSSLGYSGGGGSVPAPASSPDALTVGAACWANPDPYISQDVEPYSSYGPTIDGRIKPDLVAADQVSTATYGSSNGQCNDTAGFAGTSAAAPQAAGAAALILQHQPSLGPGGLTAALESRALSDGSNNPNDGEFQNSGDGRLMLGPAAPFGAIAWGSPADVVFDGLGHAFVSTDVTDPNWSADGSRLDGNLGGTLGSVAADGSDWQALTGAPTGVAEAVWSPDGGRIAYAGSGISVFDTGTQTTSQPVADPTATDPEWSPDGSQIAYISSAGGGSDVWVANADGSNARRLTNLGDVETDGRALSWSPDGSKIAFAAGGDPSAPQNPTTGDVWVVGADGSNAHEIVANAFQPTWSPAGNRLAILALRSGNLGGSYLLDSVNPDGTDETTLYRYGWQAEAGYWPTWFSWTSASQLRDLGPPTLNGTAQIGEALATDTGDWQSASALTFSYQWYRCDSAGANCSAIPGATQESYTATTGDLGSRLRVEVDAIAGTTSLSSRSAPSAVVAAGPPAPTGMPSINGIAEAGQTLSIASPGAWSAPVSLSYQWRNCDEFGSDCYDIPGATSTSYTPTADDVGATIRLAVRAVGAGGTSYLSSPQSDVVSAPAPTLVGSPSLSGVAAVGHPLTTTDGSWNSMVPLTGYSYQWERCDSAGASCAAIAGATGSTYTLAGVDAGHTVRAIVKATNDWAWSAAADSSPSGVVVGVPAAQALPVVSGLAVVGRSLSASTGSWSWSPTRFAYQWQRCVAGGGGCVPISGATTATYSVVAADAGKELQVMVSATNLAGTGTATSAETGAAVARPAAELAPEIGGSAKVGHRLSAVKGVWSGSPTQYRYQWLRCNAKGGACRSIPRATRTSYRLAAGDLRHRIRVRVTATNAAGTASATSRPTAPVKRR
jgi:hypothetical protein